MEQWIHVPSVSKPWRKPWALVLLPSEQGRRFKRSKWSSSRGWLGSNILGTSFGVELLLGVERSRHQESGTWIGCHPPKKCYWHVHQGPRGDPRTCWEDTYSVWPGTAVKSPRRSCEMLLVRRRSGTQCLAWCHCDLISDKLKKIDG